MVWCNFSSTKSQIFAKSCRGPSCQVVQAEAGVLEDVEFWNKLNGQDQKDIVHKPTYLEMKIIQRHAK